MGDTLDLGRLSAVQTLLDLLIAGRVTEPEKVRIDSTNIQDITTLTIHVTHRDVGKLI